MRGFKVVGHVVSFFGGLIPSRLCIAYTRLTKSTYCSWVLGVQGTSFVFGSKMYGLLSFFMLFSLG